VAAVRALDSDDQLLDLCAEAGPLGELLLTLHEDGPPALAARLDPVLPRDRDPAAPGKVEAALRTQAAGSALVVVDGPGELERALAQPIEDWMIYLHPAQAAAVHRLVGGPARVRGPAGTGKRRSWPSTGRRSSPASWVGAATTGRCWSPPRCPVQAPSPDPRSSRRLP
jgi:hypothetical protein